MTTVLAVVAMLAVLNPPRRVLELDPRPRPAIVVAGGGGVLAVLVAVAALSGPLLEWLDVSVPTFRIAAGLVVGIRALVDLMVAPKPEPEGLAGWGEALSPVGFPVLLRPELVVLTVAAGADLGVVRAGLAATLAVAAGVVALTTWPGRRLARPAAVSASVVATVVGVVLVVDGVLDI